jgi:hypothetical protein
MSSDFIPSSDEQARTWMLAFDAGIAAAPATYDLVSADATAISAAVDAFDVALTVSSNPATRTPVTINTKDETRAAAAQICRQYAAQIKVNGGISDSNKIAIGVRPVNPDRAPVPPPGTPPLLSVAIATAGVQQLRYADLATPDSGAKPAGVASLQLYVALGTEPTLDPEAAEFHGLYTRNPVTVNFDAADGGKVATYFARWTNTKGEVGPWSTPVSQRVAA